MAIVTPTPTVTDKAIACLLPIQERKRLVRVRMNVKAPNPAKNASNKWVQKTPNKAKAIRTQDGGVQIEVGVGVMMSTKKEWAEITLFAR